MSKSLIRHAFRPDHPSQAGNRLNEPAGSESHLQHSRLLGADTTHSLVLPERLRSGFPFPLPDLTLACPHRRRPVTTAGRRPQRSGSTLPGQPGDPSEGWFSLPFRLQPPPATARPVPARRAQPWPGVGALRQARRPTRRGAGVGSAGQVARTSGGEGDALRRRPGTRRAGRIAPATGLGLSRGGSALQLGEGRRRGSRAGSPGRRRTGGRRVGSAVLSVRASLPRIRVGRTAGGRSGGSGRGSSLREPDRPNQSIGGIRFSVCVLKGPAPQGSSCVFIADWPCRGSPRSDGAPPRSPPRSASEPPPCERPAAPS